MKTAWILLLTCLVSISHATAKDPEAAAISELFRLLEVEKMMEMSLPASVEALARQTDQPERARPKLERFVKETVGFKVIKPELTQFFKKHFTAPEIQELIRFYKSPVGSKFSKIQPRLFNEVSRIGQSKLEARQDDLQDLLQEFKNKK